jgi:enoyl-[acyl-carrier protein] reductase II
MAALMPKPWSNRLTELLQIRYPIIQAGMVWVSGAKLAAAVARAGGLGLIGGGSMEPDLFARQINKCRKLIGSSGRFGVNIPLLSKYAAEQVDIAIAEKVGVVVTAAGSPRHFTTKLKQAGCLVGHVVPSAALAAKVEAAGADFVIAEGTEAGGHNSPLEITTMVLIPQVCNQVRIPVVAAGGVADGRSLVAALALGAEAVQVGTRFAASSEAAAAADYKQAIIEAKEGDTVLILKEIVPTRMLRTPFAEAVIAATHAGASREDLLALLGRGRARKGIFEGHRDVGEYEMGQVSGRINEILPAEDIIRIMVNEARQRVHHLTEQAS